MITGSLDAFFLKGESCIFLVNVTGKLSVLINFIFLVGGRASDSLLALTHIYWAQLLPDEFATNVLQHNLCLASALWHLPLHQSAALLEMNEALAHCCCCCCCVTVVVALDEWSDTGNKWKLMFDLLLLNNMISKGKNNNNKNILPWWSMLSTTGAELVFLITRTCHSNVVGALVLSGIWCNELNFLKHFPIS